MIVGIILLLINVGGYGDEILWVVILCFDIFIKFFKYNVLKYILMNNLLYFFFWFVVVGWEMIYFLDLLV